MEKKKEVEVRSEEVQEVLSHIPSWMVRWGITLIFVLILLVISLSWFIKYPDLIQGQVVLTSEQPPSRLVSQTNGYIEKLFIENDTKVNKGKIVAEIKNPINKASIDSLNVYINNSKIEIQQLQGLSDLGLLQNEVNTLLNNLIEYRDLITNNYHESSIQNLSDQAEYNNRLAWITKQELDLLKIEIANAKDKFEADSILYGKGVIAKHTFYQNQSEYLAKRQQMINAKKVYVQHRINSANYDKQKIDIQKDYEDKKRQLETAIQNSKNTIKTSITNWKQSFVYTAPIGGKLTYLSNLSEQQYIKSGQALFAIIPSEEEIIGIVRIADQAFGKVQLNQKVRMKFNNFPFQEFGQLVGKVSEISKIPSEQGYFVKVRLEDGLETTYNKKIDYKPEMRGVAEVVTEDLRLIERIFNNFRKALDKTL